MKTLLLILFSFNCFAETSFFQKSLESLRFETIAINRKSLNLSTNYSDKTTGNKVTYSTNTNNIYSFSLTNNFLDITYSFQNKNGSEQVAKSNLNELMLSFIVGDFNINLDYIHVLGARLDNKSKLRRSDFYGDYTSTKRNINVEYYFNSKDHDYIQSPAKRIKNLVKTGNSYLSSWILSATYDDSSVNLPNVRNRATNSNLKGYLSSFDSSSLSMGLGYRFNHTLWNTFNYGLSALVGPNIFNSTYRIDGELKEDNSSPSLRSDFKIEIGCFFTTKNFLRLFAHTVSNKYDFDRVEINSNTSSLAIEYNYFL